MKNYNQTQADYQQSGYNEIGNGKTFNVVDSIDKGKTLDVAKILSACLKYWWVILLSGIVFAGAGFAAAKITHEQTYSSQISFIASNTSSENGTQKVVDSKVYSKDYTSSSDVTASKDLTNTFVYVLTSNEILQNCIDSLHLSNMFPNTNSLKKCIEVEAIEDTQKLDLTVTTKDAKVSKDIADEIMNNYEEVLDDVMPYTSLKVLDEPQMATNPNSDNNSVIFTGVGGLIGLCLCALIILIKVSFDDTITNVEDINRYIGLDVLGIVPACGGKNKKKSNGKNKDFTNGLITSPTCEFSYIETFKSIRTKISNISLKKNLKSFVVTSTIANEGKTTVSVNIALALAQTGKSVLLIDGDIRQPSIDKILGIKNDPNFGLTNVLNGLAKLEDSIYYIENYNICVLLSGAEVNNPSELLSKREVKEIISAAEKEFDYVIIDSPPANLVTDSAIIGQCVDSTVLVVRQKHARIVDVKYVADDILNNGCDILGCVFNGVERGGVTMNRYYGYYGYCDKQSKTVVER